MKADFERRWLLDCCANGSLTIRERGHEPIRGTLPVFSTDTRDEAESLRVLHCRLANDGSGIYFLNDRPQDVGDLQEITAMFRVSYPRIRGQWIPLKAGLK